MNGEVSYNRFSFYGNSKLYQVREGGTDGWTDGRRGKGGRGLKNFIAIPFQMMSAFSLQRRVMGSGVTVSLVHPGLVSAHLVM